MSSWTQAVGWSGLFNGFAGKNTKKISPVDLLPYPDELKSGEKISKRTATLLLKHLSEINPKYVGSIAEVISLAVDICKAEKKSQ